MRHDHHRRTEDRAVHAVALLVHVDDRALGHLGVLALPDGLLARRVERLAERVDRPPRPPCANTSRICARTISHALQQLGDVAARRRVLDRALEVVEHGQQLLDDALPRARDRVRLLALHALAVVLELRLHALREREVLGRLPLRQLELRAEVALDELAGRRARRRPRPPRPGCSSTGCRRPRPSPRGLLRRGTVPGALPGTVLAVCFVAVMRAPAYLFSSSTTS